MSDNWVQDVYDFHQKFECHVQDNPGLPPRRIQNLRQDLITEEFGETEDAILHKDVPALADAIVDLIYVLIGTAISYGIDIRPIWDAVHTANMAKVGGGERSDGKILKPEGWVPPDIEGLLVVQGWQKEDE